jgi:hypothetical protein
LRVRADAGFGFHPVFAAHGNSVRTICGDRAFDPGVQTTAPRRLL